MSQDPVSSDKRIAANRENSKKSPGPRNTTSTRFNAVKHGLLASGITELDDAEGYRALLDLLIEDKKPAGVIEDFLVESISLEMVRVRRARRLEAEYITGELNPPIVKHKFFDEDELLVKVDPGIPAPMGFERSQRLVSIFQRYESTFALRMLRFMHELERLQRIRFGGTRRRGRHGTCCCRVQSARRRGS